ncbi:MAG TPA: hypothetical protein VIX18_01660, partial [Nitrospirota bacterium]
MDMQIIFTSRIALVAVSVLLVSCAGSVPTKSATSLNLSDTEFYRFTDPTARLNRQSDKFKHEYMQVAKRRSPGLSVSTEAALQRPENIVGLGLSGGGIRSASFQLGVLSGLRGQKE